MNVRQFKDLQIGQVAESSRLIIQEDVTKFCELSGDYNPIHTDENYAKETLFGRVIAHGPFVLTLITTVFATKLPGPGSIYLYQDLRFVQPVYIGDFITARVEILDLNSDKKTVLLNTSCKNQNEKLVIIGTAKLKLLQ